MPNRQDKAAPALARKMKDSIRTARLKAVLSVNQEMIAFFWSTGRDIVERQKSGDSAIIERLSRDFQALEPGNICFTRENIERMRAFFLAWPKIGDYPPRLPWSHQIVLLEQLKKWEDRLWYAYQAFEYGWSSETLESQIKARIHKRPKSRDRKK